MPLEQSFQLEVWYISAKECQNSVKGLNIYVFKLLPMQKYNFDVDIVSIFVQKVLQEMRYRIVCYMTTHNDMPESSVTFLKKMEKSLLFALFSFVFSTILLPISNQISNFWHIAGEHSQGSQNEEDHEYSTTHRRAINISVT